MSAAGRHAARLGRAWPLCVAALLCALLWPAGSEAYVACERSGSSLTVSLSEREDSVRITRGGTRIDVVVAIGDIFGSRERGFALPCAGGVSRVDDTDTIRVEEAPAVLGGRLDVDLGGGPLAPGLTPEADGTGEIEVQAAMNGRFSSVVIHGTVFPDRFGFGRTAEGAFGANLNSGLEAAPDVDLALDGAEIVAAEGRRGADRIVASGAAGFSGPLGGRTFAAGGGAGWDRIVGGRAVNILVGGNGRDRLAGSKRTDYLEGGDGPDVLLAGRGADLADSKRGGRDRVDCGAGNDYAAVDRKDKARSCGELPRKGKGKRRFRGLLLRLFPAIILVDDVLSPYAAPLAALPEPPAEAPVPPESADNLPASAE